MKFLHLKVVTVLLCSFLALGSLKAQHSDPIDIEMPEIETDDPNDNSQLYKAIGKAAGGLIGGVGLLLLLRRLGDKSKK